MSKLKILHIQSRINCNCAEKSGWYEDAKYLSEKIQKNTKMYTLKKSVCQKLWQGPKVSMELGDVKFNASKEIINGTVVDGNDSDFVQKVSKTFMKGGEEKGVNYLYPVNWINPKMKNRKVTAL